MWVSNGRIEVSSGTSGGRREVSAAGELLQGVDYISLHDTKLPGSDCLSLPVSMVVTWLCLTHHLSMRSALLRRMCETAARETQWRILNCLSYTTIEYWSNNYAVAKILTLYWSDDQIRFTTRTSRSTTNKILSWGETHHYAINRVWWLGFTNYTSRLSWVPDNVLPCNWRIRNYTTPQRKIRWSFPGYVLRSL